MQPGGNTKTTKKARRAPQPAPYIGSCASECLDSFLTYSLGPSPGYKVRVVNIRCPTKFAPFNSYLLRPGDAELWRRNYPVCVSCEDNVMAELQIYKEIGERW